MSSLLLFTAALNIVIAILSSDIGDDVWKSIHIFCAGACCSGAAFTY